MENQNYAERKQRRVNGAEIIHGSKVQTDQKFPREKCFEKLS